MSHLDDAADRTYAWFGVLVSRGFSLYAQHLKVFEEAREYADDNENIEELADVFITVMGALVQQGWTIDDLAVAIDSKMSINEKRTWRQMPDGTNQHIEEIRDV